MSNITELAAFFPAGTPQPEQPATVKAVPFAPGETYEQALARQAERKQRIEQQLNRRAYMGGLSRNARKAQYDDL